MGDLTKAPFLDPRTDPLRPRVRNLAIPVLGRIRTNVPQNSLSGLKPLSRRKTHTGQLALIKKKMKGCKFTVVNSRSRAVVVVNASNNDTIELQLLTANVSVPCPLHSTSSSDPTLDRTLSSLCFVRGCCFTCAVPGTGAHSTNRTRELGLAVLHLEGLSADLHTQVNLQNRLPDPYASSSSLSFYKLVLYCAPPPLHKPFLLDATGVKRNK